MSLTVEEIVGQGVMRSKATDWVGMYTWTFQDGKAQFDYKDMAGAGFSCQADVATVENVVKVTYSSGSDCENEVDDIQWRLHEDGLHLHLVAIKNAPFLENKAYLEAKPWQKVE